MKKDTCYLISVAGRLVKSRANKLLEELNITFPQYLILHDILQNGKKEEDLQESSPACIASSLTLDRPTVTGIIDRLESQSLILREPNKSDRRSQNIRLTGRAMELIQKTEEILTGNRDKALAGISEENLAVFEACLNQVIKNMSTEKET